MDEEGLIQLFISGRLVLDCKEDLLDVLGLDSLNHLLRIQGQVVLVDVILESP